MDWEWLGSRSPTRASTVCVCVHPHFVLTVSLFPDGEECPPGPHSSCKNTKEKDVGEVEGACEGMGRSGPLSHAEKWEAQGRASVPWYRTQATPAKGRSSALPCHPPYPHLSTSHLAFEGQD